MRLKDKKKPTRNNRVRGRDRQEAGLPIQVLSEKRKKNEKGKLTKNCKLSRKDSKQKDNEGVEKVNGYRQTFKWGKRCLKEKGVRKEDRGRK